MSNEGLATVDNAGTVRLWETGVANLERSLEEWRRMLGGTAGEQLTIERDRVKEPEAPKHGKVDPDNMPHVGGGTWAGGTGGANTAGLGGLGGPYRLDAGHNVHQVPEEAKARVPEHIRRAAREMNRKAFEERLREIHMSEYDADLYDRCVWTGARLTQLPGDRTHSHLLVLQVRLAGAQAGAGAEDHHQRPAGKGQGQAVGQEPDAG